MRIWTGKSHFWANVSSKDLFKSWRRFFDLILENGYFFLEHALEAELTDGKHTQLYYGYLVTGLRLDLRFGYECLQYDGYWKSISLGPFFVSWYSDND